MNKVYKRLAKEVGIRVGYQRGLENHGQTFVVTHGSDAIGGQCSKCNVIVWANARLVEIFNKPIPQGIPSSGPQYMQYAKSLDQEFLHSLSPCPQCGEANSFDLFVNNISQTRYEDGTLEPWVEGKEFYDTSNEADAWVWWVDFDCSS